MAQFVVEAQFLMPVFRHTVYEADSVEAAIAMALADDDWEAQKPDYESSRETEITGVWAGDEPYCGPDLLSDASERKAETRVNPFEGTTAGADAAWATELSGAGARDSEVSGAYRAGYLDALSGYPERKDVRGCTNPINYAAGYQEGLADLAKGGADQ
jgi:hypothetical protein